MAKGVLMMETMAKKLAASAFLPPWKPSPSPLPPSAPRLLQSFLMRAENRGLPLAQDDPHPCGLPRNVEEGAHEGTALGIAFFSPSPSAPLRDLYKSVPESLLRWPSYMERFPPSAEQDSFRRTSIDLERIWRVSTNSSYMPPPSEEIEEVILPGQHEDTSSPMLMHTKRTFNPSTIVRKRRHGFLARKSTVGGRRVLARRLAKGRRILSA